MPWVKLDDRYDDHPKVVAVGHEAAWMSIRALLWCARNGTNGFVAQEAVNRIGADFSGRKRRELSRRLVDHSVWHEPGHECPTCPAIESGFVIHAYLQYQPAAASKSELSDVRSAAGKKGAQARWGTGKPDSKHDGKPIANDLANQMANGWPQGRQTDAPDPDPLFALAKKASAEVTTVARERRPKPVSQRPKHSNPNRPTLTRDERLARYADYAQADAEHHVDHQLAGEPDPACPICTGTATPVTVPDDEEMPF